MVHIYLLSILVHICFIYFYLAFKTNNNDSTTTYIDNSTTSWLCNMHVVPIRASSPQLMEHRLSTGHQAPNFIWMIVHSTGHQAPNLYIWMIIHSTGHQAPNLYEYAWTQQLNQQRRTTSTTWQHQRQSKTSTTTSTTTYSFNDKDDNDNNNNINNNVQLQ